MEKVIKIKKDYSNIDELLERLIDGQSYILSEQEKLRINQMNMNELMEMVVLNMNDIRTSIDSIKRTLKDDVNDSNNR